MSGARSVPSIVLFITVASAAWAGAEPGSLRAARSGGDVVLTWESGTGPYAVFRGTDPSDLARPANYLATTALLTHTDQGAAGSSSTYFYLVGDELECIDHTDCDDSDPCDGFERCDLAVGVCEPAPILPRSTTDRPDDVVGPQLHMTYVLPADGTDDLLDISGQLDAEVRVAQRWYQEQVGDCVRFDTFEGSLDVTFARLTRTSEELAAHPDFADKQLSLELEARGLDDPETLYVVYYGGTMDNGGCGGAAAVGGGGPAVQFLVERTAPGQPLTPCPYFDFVSDPEDTLRGHWAGVMNHESIHALGFVPWCAPDHAHRHPGHLRSITSDIMAYDGTGYTVYTLDATRTQYYGHANLGCLDLADSAVWHVVPPNPDPVPGKTDYVDPIEIDCSQEPGASSGEGGAPGTIRFVNMTAASVQFYWLDFDGERQPSELVPPWSDWCCGTTDEFHVFVATDADTGDCLGLYEALPGDNRILLVE